MEAVAGAGVPIIVGQKCEKNVNDWAVKFILNIGVVTVMRVLLA